MIDETLTRRLAELSMLSFTDDEIKKMTAEMTDIIALMDKVRDFDAVAAPYENGTVGFNELRRDECRQSSDTRDILSNAENVRDGSFVVPKVF